MAKKTTKAKVTDAVFEDVPETKVEATEVTAEEAVESMATAVDAIVAPDLNAGKTQIAPLNPEVALASMKEEDRVKVIALSEQIDMLKLENLMDYGSGALLRTFEQTGKFIEKERGSNADQIVIKKVVELTNKASQSNEDFNLILKEPNWLQKILLKVSSKKREQHSMDVQKAAISNYNLLKELRESADQWIAILQETMGEISESAINEVEGIELLQKYIVAGRLAQERAKGELLLLEEKANTTGLIEDSQKYEDYKEGCEVFDITLTNLENSRQLYMLSLAQLKLTQRSNRNVQISVRTKTKNTITHVSQQIRNAILDAKNREVLEGQKALTRLNDELIKEVSQSTGLTATQSEKLLYSTSCNIEAARTAVTSIINCCKEIQQTSAEMLPKMKADAAEIDKLISELEPCVASIVQKSHINKANAAVESTMSANAGSELKF